MQNIITRLAERVKGALLAAYGQELTTEFLEPEVEQSTNLQFGHYQCNNALKLAKQLKRSPREVAQKILSHFDGNPFVEKAEIAGWFLTAEFTFLLKIDQLIRDLVGVHYRLRSRE
jgi:arginyl-tRNA synthetase